MWAEWPGLKTTVARVLVLAGLPACASQGEGEDGGFAALQGIAVFELESTLAFASNRHADPLPTTGIGSLLASEIYLGNPDGSDARRLTNNSDFDGFARLSPDGNQIVFDRAPLQNPCRTSGNPTGAGMCVNVSDLLLMSQDGSEQTLLVPRAASASWSPDGKSIAFHASASGSGLPRRSDPGSATVDSDLFIVNVDDALAGSATPTNLTQSAGLIDDDPDWSPDGTKLAYTRHTVTDNAVTSNTAEIFTINLDGTGLQPLTSNNVEERAPSWSPDGSRIAYMCRSGGGSSPFEICVMNADGSGQVQVTANTVNDATPAWSPDGGNVLVAHRVVVTGTQASFQLFRLDLDGPLPTVGEQITQPPTASGFPSWGKLRVKVAP